MCAYTTSPYSRPYARTHDAGGDDHWITTVECGHQRPDPRPVDGGRPPRIFLLLPGEEVEDALDVVGRLFVFWGGGGCVG